MTKLLFYFFILLLAIPVQGQKKTYIKLVRAEKLTPTTYQGKKVQRLTGNVVFSHDQTTVYCDSAYFTDNENTMDAFGNIHINDRDSIHIYGKLLHYSGDTKIAELHENVRLVDKKMSLTTQHLIYNIPEKTAYYYDGGKIIDPDNTLTSRYGYYHSLSKTFYYQKNVVLINAEYRMNSDTLIYNTATETTTFRGPTTITSEQNSIYCERGWYNTKTNLSRYERNTILRSKSQTLFADSLFYNRNLYFGQAYRNVELYDSVKNIMLFGQFAEYYEKGGHSFFTDSCSAIIVDEQKDSLYLHADTLRLLFDTNQEAKTFYAYNKTKFFKNDIQGKCDSLVYLVQDSSLMMYRSPIVWGSKSQLSGKLIRAYLVNGKMDKIYIDTNAFVLQHDSMEYYNQISGRNMIAHFTNDSIDHVDVNGNAQTIYFVRDEQNELLGVNLGNASDLRIEFGKDGVNNIIYLHKPKASLNPIEKLSKRALYLKGFKSYEHWRPKSKHEIFIWEPAK
jgi:lipopolysaccharide export system protein LptA